MGASPESWANTPFGHAAGPTLAPARCSVALPDAAIASADTQTSEKTMRGGLTSQIYPGGRTPICASVPSPELVS